MLAVVNPAAGGGRCGRRVEETLARLRERGVELEVVRTGGPGEAIALAREAYGRGCRAFVAVGGDGTAFEVVNGIADRTERCTLGFLPLGTGNSFLRDFSEQPLEHALDCIAERRTRPCDLLRLEHRDGVVWSINLVCLGFPADVATVTNRRFKGLGTLGYVLGVLACLARLPRRTFTLRFDGEEQRARSLMVVMANSRFTGGRMMIAPGADATDGRIEVVRMGPIGRLALLRAFPRLFDGRYVDHPLAERRSARRVEMDLEGPEDWMIDGEVVRLHGRSLEVVPQALDVMA